MVADEGGITERGSHEDVGPAAAPNQVTRDLLAVADHILRGGGFMIHVAGVEVRAAIDQELRDLDRAGKMKRCLAVPAGRVHQFRIRGDQFAEFVQQAEARGGVRIDDRAALDRIRRQFGWGAVEETESARPPAALGVDVGARVEQHVEHLATTHAGNGGGVERPERFVDPGFDRGMAFEQFTEQRSVVPLKSLMQLSDVHLRNRCSRSQPAQSCVHLE